MPDSAENSGRLPSLVPQYAIAGWMIAGMLLAWTVRSIFHDRQQSDGILLIAIVVASLPLLAELIAEIAKRNFSVDVLAALSIGSAIAFDEYWVAAIVILMLSGGKALEQYATKRASSTLGALARRMPNTAHRVDTNGAQSEISADSIRPEDTLVVYPHELCPVDGVVIRGDGSMDESYLTGEPFLISKAPGAAVLSGAVNGNSALTIRATRVAADSRYAKIVEVLYASEKNRPKMRRLGDRLGAWYTPAAVAIALLSWGMTGEPERFLAVLVIATPCPLLLAIPIAVIGAISIAARRGIIVKDPAILERITSCTTLIVDKTGTLTYGKPSLTEIVCAGSWPRRTILQLSAAIEQYSKHPLAAAVLSAAREANIVLPPAEDVLELPGHGMSAHIDNHLVVLTGRDKLPPQVANHLGEVAPGLECVVLIDGELAGLMRFRDEPRSESGPFLRHIVSHHAFESTVLLSGDRVSEVASFARRMGIAQLHGGASPEDKVAIVRDLTRRHRTLYIGDGINDAPAMMNATAGVALGVNSDITSEAAGAVVLQSSLASIDELIHIGSRMKRIALTSAVGGIFLSVVGMGASAWGLLKPIEGALLQEAIDLLAILNSLRIILPVKEIGDFTMPAQAEDGRQHTQAVAAPHSV